MNLELKKYFAGQHDTFRCALDLSGLELDGVKPFCAPVTVQARFRSFAGSVLLDAHLVYQVVMPCDRCGELTKTDWEKDFSHVLVRALGNEQDDDGDEYVVVPEERLDLDELLREDILLELPSKYLCSPDCRGLCPRCGANLNLGDCGCDRREIDPRLEVLKDLL